MTAEDDRPDCWPLHFGIDESYDPQDRRVLLIQELGTFLLTEAGQRFLAGLNARTLSFHVDFSQLCSAIKSNDLPVAMEQQPATCLQCISAAVYEV